MAIEVRDVFICTSVNARHADFEANKNYAIEFVEGKKVKFQGVGRDGFLLPEHDYYVFGQCELEATFERPTEPF